MPDPSQLQRCDKCGAVLSGYGADRLCAACLLESAIAEPESATAALKPLLTFNDYEVLEEIARGGMGVVYRARQISLNRPVALKMILGGQLANAAEVKRFRTEAETAAQLQHPHIVAIHEVGEHAGQPFFSMDLVEGRNLAQLVRDEPLPSRKAAEYLKTIAEAVQYAHSRGVLHRDLKPSNVLIDENDQPRITDFGLAKRLSDPQLSTNDPQLTQTGQVLGSPSFIPPEQAAGQKNAISPASDVYSLGAILYHCLTARPPFVAETLTQTLRLVAEQEPVSPRLLNASVPRDLETICLKCLEKDAGRRYATAQALADDLNRFLSNEPILARPVSLMLKVHRWCVRNKPLAIAGTTILALLLVVAIGSPIALLRIDAERKRAEKLALDEARHREEAVAARQNESRLRQDAQTRELEARRQGYSSDMALIEQALESNPSRVRELLDRYRPKPDDDPADALGGWEWRYFWQFSKDDSAVRISSRSSDLVSVSFSSNGGLLAAGTGAGELTVWDLDSRALILRQEPSEESLRRVAFAPTGDLLAYYDRAGVVLWNSSTREEIRRLEIGNYVRELSFTTHGTLFTAQPNHPEGVTLWEVETGKRTQNFAALIPAYYFGTVFTATPDGRYFAHAKGYHDVRVVSTTDKSEWVFRATDNVVTGISFTRDGRLLATGSAYDAGEVRLWDVQNRQSLGSLAGHPGWITGLKFLPDDETLVSAGAEGTIRFWDVRTRQPVQVLRGALAAARAFDLSQDGRWLATGCWGGGLYLRDTALASTRPPLFRTLPEQPIRAWAFAPDGRLVGVVSEAKVKLYDVASTRLVSEPDLPLTNINYVAFAPDKRMLVATDDSGHLAVWDLVNQQVLTQMVAHVGAAYVAPEGFLPAGKRLLTFGDDHLLKEWDTETWQETRQWPLLKESKGPYAVAFSGTGDLVAATAGSVIELLQLNQPTPPRRLDPGHRIQDMALSRDGTKLATVGGLDIWDIAEGKRIAYFGDAHSAVFSPDGRRVVGGGGDKRALSLWDLQSRQVVGHLEGKGPIFQNLAFSPDGNMIGGQNLYGVLHLWRAPSWTEIEAAERVEADRAILSGDLRLSAERAIAYAKLGRWKEAATDMAKALEVATSDHHPYHLLAPLLVASGDVDGYRRHCERVQVQFADTKDPLIAERMAKACLILPDPITNFQIINQLVSVAMTAETNSSLLEYSTFVNGLAAYRQNDHPRALETLRQLVNRPGNDPYPRIGAWTVIAMANHQLTRVEAASTALSNGLNLARTKLPRNEAGDLGTAWNDWIVVQALFRQARTLIEGKDPGATLYEPADAAHFATQSQDQWRIYGRRGRLKEAATSLKQSIQSDPNNKEPYLRLAAILVLNGDLQEYRQLCQKIAEQFGAIQEAGWAENAAKACSIDPRSGVDLKTTAAWAETAVRLGAMGGYFPWFALSRSLTEYRQEHFSAAVDWAQKSLAAAGPVPERDAAAYLVLAMAQTQLKQTSAAREAFARGVELVEKKLPKLDSGDLGVQWVDVLIAHILMREARALIEGEPAPPTQP